MSQIEYPFPPDTKPEPVNDPIKQAVEKVRAEHKASVISAREAWEREAIESWENSESARRTRHIAQFKEDSPFLRPEYRYSRWDDESIYRDRLPAGEAR